MSTETTDQQEAQGAELVQDNFLSSADHLAALLERSEEKNLKKAVPLMRVTSDYFTLAKEGESITGIFAGYTTCTFNKKEGEGTYQLPAIRIVKDRKILVNAGVALVNEFERANIPVETVVTITFVAKKGNAKIYAVDILGEKQ